MKQKKTYPHARFGILVITAMYLFIIASHLFFAPGFRNNINISHNFFSRRNYELIYNLIRTNRCTFNDNKTNKTYTNKLPAHTILSMAMIKLVKIQIISSSHLSQFVPDQHLCYLSNRILRI